MAHFDYYLIADTKKEILDDLRAQGFEWYDGEDDITIRDPKRNEIVSVRGVGACIYLEHLVETPAVIDPDTEEIVTPAVYTTTFHANARMRGETDFATAMDPVPSTPANTWL